MKKSVRKKPFLILKGFRMAQQFQVAFVLVPTTEKRNTFTSKAIAEKNNFFSQRFNQGAET